MALQARLTPTLPEPARAWPWHKAKWSTVRASQVACGDRRMEAETYLSSGYGIRIAIESKPAGWVRLDARADVWMPGRLKGVQVNPQDGTPFLSATAVFDMRPIPRKWLAPDQTADYQRRFVKPGMILVTCSGTVGRPTLVTDVHKGLLISHDLLRVEAHDSKQAGWIYGFLHAPQTRAMTVASHYGQIIKHLDTKHLGELPLPVVDSATEADFTKRLRRILQLRNEANRLTVEAEQAFEDAIGSLTIDDIGEQGFTVRASASIMNDRRRFDAMSHNPALSKIRRHLEKHGKGFIAIGDAGYEVWLPNRFKRIPAKDGVKLWGSSSLTEVNPESSKLIADGDFGDPYRGRVEPGWVLMARSGQVYGIIGTPVLASEAMGGHVISDDVMRLRPTMKVAFRPGYLVTALSHPTLGRPLVKALAFGSSIPHLDVADVQRFQVVRVQSEVESEIAKLADESASARYLADALEQELARYAGKIIDRFIAKPILRLVVSDRTAEEEEAAERFAVLAKQWRIERDRGSDVAAMIDHPSYRSIIDIGELAVRPILEDLRRKPDHWFPALNAITGANPVSIEQEGRLKGMADAWIEWGRGEGYLS